MIVLALFGRHSYCDRCYRGIVCLSICCTRATAVAQNEMLFGSYTQSQVVQSNIVLDRVPTPHRKRRLRELVCLDALHIPVHKSYLSATS